LKLLVNRILGRQLLIVFFVSAASVVFGWIVVCSTAVGGTVSLVCNYFFARRVFATGARSSSQALLLTFYWAEMVKIVMAAVLLAAAYGVFRELNVFALIAGFLVSHVGASLSLGIARAIEKCN
jgi:F0F1-type ATP synthase assembly protein I